MTIAPELVADMTERQFQAYVEGLLRFYGWRHFHAPDNKPTPGRSGRAGKQHVEPGFPDLLATRRLRRQGPELLVAELKTEKGRASAQQREWLTAFNALAASVNDLVDVDGEAFTCLECGGEGSRNPSQGCPTCGRIDPPATRPPAIGVYLWRPTDANELEAILAGPHGIGVPVDRVADLEDGDVVDQGNEEREGAC